MQRVLSGSVEASINQALTESLGIPLHLQTIRYARDGDGAYALTTDGRIDLPAELGDAAINFTDHGFTSSGFTGEILVGEAMQGGTCSMLDDASSARSEEHKSELQSRGQLGCRLLLEKKNDNIIVASISEIDNRIYRAC